MDRKLVKQTVMTSVYGVTYIGARDQIMRRLKERGLMLDDKDIFGCACYAAKVRDRVHIASFSSFQVGKCLWLF